jgi:hypothetical protein
MPDIRDAAQGIQQYAPRPAKYGSVRRNTNCQRDNHHGRKPGSF